MTLPQLQGCLPIGVWAAVGLISVNFAVSVVTFQTNRDVIANEREVAFKTNAFLERIQEEEKERLSGNTAYMNEFRQAVTSSVSMQARGLDNQLRILDRIDRLERLIADHDLIERKTEPSPTPTP